MKKTVCLMIVLVLAVTCVACSSKTTNSNSRDRYSLNLSYGLGGDTTQTILSLTAYIGGEKDDLDNIDSYEVLNNMEYDDMLVQNGPYNSRHENDYIEITGTIIFDTIGMTKEDIDAISLLEGIKLIDKDGNEYILYIPQDEKAAG